MDFKFNTDSYEDLPLIDKSSKELIYMVLKTSSGVSKKISKYSNSEINQSLRYLIRNGFIRGTIIDFNNCTWSKITRKGLYLLKQLEKEI